MSEQLSAEALAERARRAIQWRLDHYGPRDAEPFQYSRFESEAHAAFDAVLTSEWLAAHVAAARAEERERVLRQVGEALRAESVDAQNPLRQRGRDPVGPDGRPRRRQRQPPGRRDMSEPDPCPNCPHQWHLRCKRQVYVNPTLAYAASRCPCLSAFVVDNAVEVTA